MTIIDDYHNKTNEIKIEVPKNKNIPRSQPNEDGYLSVTPFDQSWMYLLTRVY
jgi:hypothetical protein